jgi:hypothetical protein
MRRFLPVLVAAGALFSSGVRAPVAAPSPYGRIVAAPNMHVARASHAQVLLPDGRVFIAGGFSGSGGESSPYRSTEFFDPRTGAFSDGPLLTVGRSTLTATVQVDGRVLLAGGYSAPGGPRGVAELFDPASGTITVAGQMVVPRAGQTATLLSDGRVLMVGGRDPAQRALASAELYDPRTQTFTLTDSMSVPRAAHTATLLADGRVLVAGGGAGRYPREQLQSRLEIYDPSAGRFSPAGHLLTPRYKHAAALLPDGRVLIVGGSDSRAWSGQFASTEVCDVAAPACAPGPEMKEQRFKLPGAVTGLADGSVLIAGGGADAELLLAGRARLVTVPGTLGAARYFAAATRLADGRVLVTGGYARTRGGLPASNAARLYVPGS